MRVLPGGPAVKIRLLIRRVHEVLLLVLRHKVPALARLSSVHLVAWTAAVGGTRPLLLRVEVDALLTVAELLLGNLLVVVV